MKPVLKWVGGKRQLLNKIKSYIPESFDTYYEPFCGGGAVYFELEPQKARINDLNEELINVYQQIKTHPNQLIKKLEYHKNHHNFEYFYLIRNMDRDEKSYIKLTKVEKAARFIYLNKTCFNGLYRVNKNNQFNVPIGKYKCPTICDKDNILLIHQLFITTDVRISKKDFALFLKEAEKGDFVYLDPPYDPVSKSSSFTAYQTNGFSKEEQIRLKSVCDMLNKREVKFILSNSDTQFINELYKDYKIIKVLANRSINSDSSKRTGINEVLIMNY